MSLHNGLHDFAHNILHEATDSIQNKAVEWLRNNYQDHATITDLCDGMRKELFTKSDTTEIDPKDIRVDTFIPGTGGGWITKHDAGVRITHIPSGIVVEHSYERSQHRNIAIAFGLLKLALEKLKAPSHVNE